MKPWMLAATVSGYWHDHRDTLVTKKHYAMYASNTAHIVMLGAQQSPNDCDGAWPFFVKIQAERPY